MNSFSSNIFGLPDDYTPNPLPQRGDDDSRQDIYWTDKRIRLSHLYQRSVYRTARGLAEQFNARVICDVGCGPATKLVEFFDDQFELIGIDRAEAIELCQHRHSRGLFVVGDLALKDPVDEELPQADLVICADVIEHLEQPDRLLSLLKKIARDGGIIVISTPERTRLHGSKNRRPSNPEHIREWSQEEFSEFLQHAGFELIQHVVQPQMHWGWSLSSWEWMIGRWLRGRTALTNQVVICRPIEGE